MTGRTLRTIAGIVLWIGATAAWGQEEVIPRIPRRVLFDLERLEPANAPDTMLGTAPERLPDFLYTRVSQLQPVVRVFDTTEAHSVVTTEVGASDGSVAVVLRESGAELARYRFDPGGGIPAFTGFVTDTAAALAPRLGFVAPEVVVVFDSDQDERGQIVRDVVLADRLASRFEFTLWLSGLMRNIDTNQDIDGARVALDPFALEASWFLRRNLGLTAALWIHYSDFLYFGRTVDGQGAQGLLNSFFLLPGVGVTYRTLQRVSGSAGVTLYAGPVWVTNESDETVGDDRDGFEPWLEPGESTTLLYSMVVLHGGLGVSLDHRWTLRTRFSINIRPAMLLGFEEDTSYPSDGAGGFFHYLSLGVGYRR